MVLMVLLWPHGYWKVGMQHKRGKHFEQSGSTGGAYDLRSLLGH